MNTHTYRLEVTARLVPLVPQESEIHRSDSQTISVSTVVAPSNKPVGELMLQLLLGLARAGVTERLTNIVNYTFPGSTSSRVSAASIRSAR